MANTDYTPYNDVLSIYNAKVGYNQATTDEERKRQNEIATAARKNLEAYGYGDVANQLSATGADATAARKILEQYSPKTTAPDSTTLTNDELIKTNNNEVRNKTNQLWGIQNSDRQMMTDKYTKLEDTAYSNPFETDEAKAILGKYDLSALNSRNNAVASGGSANGGNIDSNAAANALRQQSALVNQGQMVVLDAHNNKINNVKGILESLGVYQQNQDKGMQNTIGLQQSEGQRLFENGETAKNNEVARLSEQASVTGYTPIEWTIKNDTVYNEFLNPDGTFKKEKENVDIQALINSAKASGDTETAQKLAAVRARKMLGNYGEFGQYAGQGDVSSIKPQRTSTHALTEQQIKSAETIAKEGNATNLALADKEANSAINQINAQIQGEKDLLEFQSKLSSGNVKLSEEGADVFKQVSKNINESIVSNYGSKYSLPADYEIIQWNGGSDYKLNLPAGHVAEWWKTQIIRPIIESSLSEDDQIAVLSSLFGQNAADYYSEVYNSMLNSGLIK